jgi:hypothetical protein
VSAHAVDHHDQRGVAVHDDINPILILRPVASQTQFCKLDSHVCYPLGDTWYVNRSAYFRRASAPAARTRCGDRLMYTPIPAPNGVKIV